MGAKTHIAWSAGEGLALASISLAPVLSSSEKKKTRNFLPNLARSRKRANSRNEEG